MSPAILALSVTVIFLLFGILILVAVGKLFYRNHHPYPSTYYPPAAPQPTGNGSSGSNILIALVFLIGLTIALVLFAGYGSPAAVPPPNGGLEFVRFSPPQLAAPEIDRTLPTIPPAYDRNPTSRNQLATIGTDQGRALPPPPVYKDPEPIAPPAIKYTYGLQVKSTSDEDWAKNEVEKLKPQYPQARYVKIPGTETPYKIIAYVSTLKSDVKKWHKRHPELYKGWVIDLP